MTGKEQLSEKERMAEQFKHPPKAYSPAPIWWWSGDRLEPDRLRYQMDRFAEGGIYNLVILNLAPAGPLYGSDADKPRFKSAEWWDIFDQVCQYADHKEISLWFYDQIGFSGANLQGDIVLAQPDFAGQSLDCIVVEGTGRLEAVCPSGGVPLAAYSTLLSVEGGMQGNPSRVAVEGGRAYAESAGRHRLRLVYTVRQKFDYLSPEACRQLLNLVHGEFERRLGRWFGKVIVGSFQDELPSLPDWSPKFAAEFRTRKGYDLLDHMEHLWEGVSRTAERVRLDYQELRAVLAEEAFFRPFFQWHEQHGLICGFDQQGPVRGGDPQASVRYYADYLRTHRWYSAPGSDHHGDAKIHSSLAHLNGRERVWIEAFHSSGWGGTIEETFDWLIPWLRAGANLYNPHAAYYSTKGGWWEWAPPSTCWRQPYWRHYSYFADAVSRLCYMLTCGRHVCDIGVLFPATVVQANLTFNGLLEDGRNAQEVYLSLAGSMHWAEPKPGLLDRLCLDYDVLTDEAVEEAGVDGESLIIRGERYKAVLLPACAVLKPSTAAQLARFAESGGLLISIGDNSRKYEEESGEEQLPSDLERLFRIGAAKRAATAEEAVAMLKQLPRAVTAPVPVLHRQLTEEDSLLFVPAAFPGATEMAADHSWLEAHYRFDPGKYRESVTVAISEPVLEAELWSPFTGERRSIPWRIGTNGDRLVDIPFDTGPAAVLVWRKDIGKTNQTEKRFAPEAKPSMGVLSAKKKVLQTLEGPWTSELVPTMDNIFGDFDKPDYPGAPPLATWQFEHRVEAGEAGGGSACEGPFGRTKADASRSRVQATFGTYAKWTGPAPDYELPIPHPNADMELLRQECASWKSAVYSQSRGIWKDPVHTGTLGPKGRVPSEFLHFGEVAEGEAVHVRTLLRSPEDREIWMAVGANALKHIWINGRSAEAEREAQAEGYLSFFPVLLKAGDNILDIRLKAEAVQVLRAYWTLVREPAFFARPQWLKLPEPYIRDGSVRFEGTFAIPFMPVEGMLQVAADSACSIFVNGALTGRQGGFDPQYSTRRVIQYSLSGAFQQGENTIVIDMRDTGEPSGLLVDGFVTGSNGERALIESGTGWSVRRPDMPACTAGLWRSWKQSIFSVHEPSFFELVRRPHPLPEAEWLEETRFTGIVEDIEIDGGFGALTNQWFRWKLPPGAQSAHIPVWGSALLWVDGEHVPLSEETAVLPHPEGAGRVAVLRIAPQGGRTEGALFKGPVVYRMGRGGIELGDWCHQGLEAYSGGLSYETDISITQIPEGRCYLRLGKVRGTAEIQINGQPAGIRIWSPYEVEATGLLVLGINRLRITVYNTLAPYLDATSPTGFILPGQTESGLFGPVQLIHEAGG